METQEGQVYKIPECHIGRIENISQKMLKTPEIVRVLVG